MRRSKREGQKTDAWSDKKKIQQSEKNISSAFFKILLIKILISNVKKIGSQYTLHNGHILDRKL